MQTKREEINVLLRSEEAQLKTLQTVFSNIEQSCDFNTQNAIKVYDLKPHNENYNINDIQEPESRIFSQQANVVKQILQHPNCPENLNIEITLTHNYGTYSYDDNRTRTPLAPIFEALASGKCLARGLKITLVGEANHILTNEMNILVNGLANGMCPNNLKITLGKLTTIDAFDRTSNIISHAHALMGALKSENCSSGFEIVYEKNHQENETHFQYETELDRLCDNGSYDRENIIANITRIRTAIDRKLSKEISRLNGREGTERMGALTSLREEINAICNNEQTRIETCERSKTWEWKTSLREGLIKAINGSLESSKLDKKYSSLEKFGINLLNFVTVILFPLAMPLKYATTGTLFFSTVGKSHEAAVDALNISKSIK